MGINVLSLFDGICAGRLALERSGIEVDNFYSSEVDKFAIKVNQTRYPDNIHLGDVTKWREWDIDWSSIDMVIGGSPCQGFSVAGKQGGTKAVLEGQEVLVTDRETYLYMKSMDAKFKSQSHLFWEFVLILDHVKMHNHNIKFLLENVRMKKELLNMISEALGVKDIVINSSLLSAQNRVRHYWFNWKVEQPKDKGIFLKDILEDCNDNFYYKCGTSRGRYLVDANKQDSKTLKSVLTKKRIELRKDNKTNTLTTVSKDNIIVCEKTSDKESELLSIVDGEVRVKQATKQGYIVAEDGDGVNLSLPTSKTRRGRVIKQKSPTLETSCNVGVVKDFSYRKLTPTECARLQTFPDGWAEDIVSKSQAYKQYGNSWTVDVISHIFNGVKNELSKNE